MKLSNELSTLTNETKMFNLFRSPLKSALVFSLANVGLVLLFVTSICIVTAMGHLPFQQRSYLLKKSSFPENIIEIVEVNNLSSPHFAEELELVVKNISDKKIYGLHIRMVFPNAKVNGSTVGPRLSYGDQKLLIRGAKAGHGDNPIGPGQTVKLKLAPDRVRALNLIIAAKDLPLSAFDYVEFRCVAINFGDGSGYVGNESYFVSANLKRSYFFPNENLGKMTHVSGFTAGIFARNSKLEGKPQVRIGCNYWYHDQPGNCYDTCFPGWAQYGGNNLQYLCSYYIGCAIEGTVLDCYDDDLSSCSSPADC